MKLEIVILIISILIATTLLLVFIPKNKILDAHISFLFMQALTWIFGAIVVENRLIEYPFRFIHYAYRVSLVFEYFIFPAVSALFNVNFPVGKSLRHKIIYTFTYPTVITVIEVLLERNTLVIKYINWSWYWSWISLLLTLILSFWYYLWFTKKIKGLPPK